MGRASAGAGAPALSAQVRRDSSPSTMPPARRSPRRQSLFISPSGNFGVGTTSPFTNLSVAGNGYFSGGLTAHAITSVLNSGALTIGSGSSLNYGSTAELDSVITGSSNAHGYVDNALFTSTVNANAYASFSANANIAGTFNYNHYAAFQSAPSITTSGTTTTLYSYFAGPNISNGDRLK